VTASGTPAECPPLLGADLVPLGVAEGTTCLVLQRRAYRWTFLVSGLEHPNFVRIVEQLTDAGPAKIATAAQALVA
jgi:hypothetical protein